MSRRWHYSTQPKAEAPVDASQLRRLARDGVLKPDDLVRKQGSRRWVKAKRIQGLFASKPKWSYQHQGRTYGPVSDHQLRSLATTRMIQPMDLVWREGLPSWIEARRLRGLFPSDTDVQETPTPAPKAAKSSRTGISRRRQIAALSLIAAVGLIGIASMSLPLTRPASSVGQAEPTRPLPRPVHDTSTTPEPVQLEDDAKSDIPAPVKVPVVMDEATRGRLIHEQFMKGHRAVQDPQLSARVAAAAEAALKNLTRSKGDYRFVILDSEEVDAFSHAGGYVYLTRGLFSLVADEAELGFVIGHEIAHIDLGHDLPAGGEDVDESAAKVGSPHPDHEEFAADQWALRGLGAAGFADFETLSFLRRFRNYCDRRAMDAANSSRGTSTGTTSPSHWGVTPPPALRLARLQKPAA